MYDKYPIQPIPIKMNACFLILCFVSFLNHVNALHHVNRNKKRHLHELAQRKYNDELMKKNTININDRIYYNKLVTTLFLESICPTVSELVFMDETNLYELNQLTLEDFHSGMLTNVSNAFLNDVYTSKNYPTHRHDIVLNITIADIYKYNRHHCKKEFAKYRNLKRDALQRVHEYHIQQTNIITIDQIPYYHIKDYMFQKVLCPIIFGYKQINETFSSREKYVKSLVDNITCEYMSQVYTEKNYNKLYKNDAILQIPSEDDINMYYQLHCKHLDSVNYNYYAYLSTFVLGSAAVIVSVL